MKQRALALGICLPLLSCILPASERVELDRKVGRAHAQGMRVMVQDGLAGVRAFDGERLELWAQAPRLRIEVELTDDEARPLLLEVLNCMPGARLRVDGELAPFEPVAGHRASCRFHTSVRDGSELLLAPPDAEEAAPFVFAVLSDVQRAVGEVDDIFTRMNEDLELRFVVSTGDLVNTGARSELERFQRELALLEVPLFSTVGNHELGAPPRHWHELFGPFNVHFSYRGATFSLVDSGNATIDPEVHGWLGGWLDEARERVHAVLTHVPPLDPVGLRGGGFRSRKEAAKLVTALGRGAVDVLFLGHIHSYYAFSNAGVPTYLSGGGGAIQERLDGIERHYLRVRVDPARGIEDVAVVRVD